MIAGCQIQPGLVSGMIVRQWLSSKSGQFTTACFYAQNLMDSLHIDLYYADLRFDEVVYVHESSLT